MKREVWYWPEKNQILLGLNIKRNLLLMFFSEDEYYTQPITRKTANAIGMILIDRELV